MGESKTDQNSRSSSKDAKYIDKPGQDSLYGGLVNACGLGAWN